MEPTWLKDRTWTPFLEDGTLPVRYEGIPYLASKYTFKQVCKIYKVYRNHHRSMQILYNHWSWFSAPLAMRRASGKAASGIQASTDT